MTQTWALRFALVFALVGATAPALAQEAAARRPLSEALIEYSANESGGRIRLTAVSSDSMAVEGIRLELLEAAAAIRRGDLRMVRVINPATPGLMRLAERRQLIRCTYRQLPRGGELVLLSDDSDTVGAIHQVLSLDPPALDF
ncbi:MAG: hypothetical protein AB7R55_14495 [Gemmatimonadales bacterium]